MKQETYVVALLRLMGKDVFYLNPQKMGESRQYDFKVDGWYKVELKTANPRNGEFNLNSTNEA